MGCLEGEKDDELQLSSPQRFKELEHKEKKTEEIEKMN